MPFFAGSFGWLELNFGQLNPNLGCSFCCPVHSEGKGYFLEIQATGGIVAGKIGNRPRTNYSRIFRSDHYQG